MTEPHVSIVVPTHDRPDLLRRTVQSLLAQDYPHFDVHVVQNRDDPTTARMIEDLARSSPVELRYSFNPGQGPAPSRHFGAMSAEGEIVAFIDDDCRALPTWISEGVRCFSGQVGLVQGLTRPDPDQPRHFLEKTVNVPDLSPFFETCNIFYRKTAFDAVGGFTGVFAEKFYGEDTDLGWRVKTGGWDVVFSPTAIVNHEVFRQPLKAWLMEAWHLRNLPLLVKVWPQMRETMYLNYFLHKQSAGFSLVVLGLVLALIGGPIWLGLALPYIWIRAVERGRYANPVLVAARIILGLPRATVTFAALVTGSLRHRSLLL